MSRLSLYIPLFFALFFLAVPVAQAGGAFASPRVAGIWMEPAVQVADSDVLIEAAYEPVYPADAVIPIACTITSGTFIGSAEVIMTVEDAEQNEIFRGSQILDLLNGQSQCNFSFDVGGLAAGAYTARISLEYQGRIDEETLLIPFKKMDSALFLEQLADLQQRMDALLSRQEDARAAGNADYLRTRLMLGQETLDAARMDAAQGRWRALDEKLVYLRHVINSAYAGLAMGDALDARQERAPQPDLRRMEIREGALFSNGRPTYLFGARLSVATPEAIERIALIGLHFAVVGVRPEGAFDPGAFHAKYAPVFAAAERHGIGLVVQLQTAGMGGGNLGAFREHLSRVLPHLQSQPSVLAVSVAEDPAFAFQGSDVRRAFITYAKERYPDRMDLNRAWRSHLAGHEHIEIHGDFPEHSYQNRRAYQFDWQQFHQDLGTRYFERVVGHVREQAPGLLITATLPNTAFTHGESRYGVDRESVSRLVDLNAASAGLSPMHQYYSIAYPDQSAYYTLLRSMEPGKPVVNLNSRIEFLQDMDSVWVRSYVQTALWESVMSGLNAVAFTFEDGLFNRADALDALSVAALDINRLAPLIHAFDRAPGEIAVLFSKSSKIFDDGQPHLDSSWYAFEGSSFGGYNVRFITESQIIAGGLANVRALVLPETPAIADATFRAINDYAVTGGNLIRVGTPIPYNEHGMSRRETVRHTPHTVLVRGMNLPTEYLHAIDAVIDVGELPTIPRTINSFGYPIEGVKSRYIQHEGAEYLYIVNLRKEPVLVDLHGQVHKGRDLIRGRILEFPRSVRPLDPMLIRLERERETVALTAVPERK